MSARWSTVDRTTARRFSRKAWRYRIGLHPSGVKVGTTRTRRGAERRARQGWGS